MDIKSSPKLLLTENICDCCFNNYINNYKNNIKLNKNDDKYCKVTLPETFRNCCLECVCSAGKSNFEMTYYSFIYVKYSIFFRENGRIACRIIFPTLAEFCGR